MVTRASADPASAVRAHGSYLETKSYLANLDRVDDPLATTPQGERARLNHIYSKSEFFRQPLPTEAVTALVHHLSGRRVDGQSRVLDFTPWAGAYNRVRPDATAFVHRNERFLLKHDAVVTVDASTADRDAAGRWLRRSWALAHPWGSGGVYPNFPDPDLAGWARAYYGTNVDRLRRVKARYDPEGFFGVRNFLSSEPADADNDGQGNVCDTDPDNDGLSNALGGRGRHEPGRPGFRQ